MLDPVTNPSILEDASLTMPENSSIAWQDCVVRLIEIIPPNMRINLNAEPNSRSIQLIDVYVSPKSIHRGFQLSSYTVDKGVVSVIGKEDESGHYRITCSFKLNNCLTNHRLSVNDFNHLSECISQTVEMIENDFVIIGTLEG